MKFISTFKVLVTCFAISLFVACQTNTPEAAATTEAAAATTEATPSSAPADAAKPAEAATRFEGMGVSDPKIVIDFVEKVKAAFQKKDKAAIAAMCTFPLRVNGGKPVANAADLEKQFDKVFTDKAIAAIVSQRNSDLMANDQGLMLGTSGQAWAQYDEATKTLKLFVVNL